MLKAEYQSRGPVPQDVIEAVPFERPALADGEVLLEMLAAPINPSDILTLTGLYGMLPPLPAIGGNGLYTPDFVLDDLLITMSEKGTAYEGIVSAIAWDE